VLEDLASDAFVLDDREHAASSSANTSRANARFSSSAPSIHLLFFWQVAGRAVSVSDGTTKGRSECIEASTPWYRVRWILQQVLKTIGVGPFRRSSYTENLWAYEGLDPEIAKMAVSGGSMNTPFKCPACGHGTVRPETGPGRTCVYKALDDMPVPDDYPIPKCDHCGEGWMSQAEMDALDAAMEPSYEATLRERNGRALSVPSASQSGARRGT
jgi:hypothetical protein